MLINLILRKCGFLWSSMYERGDRKKVDTKPGEGVLVGKLENWEGKDFLLNRCRTSWMEAMDC